MSIGSVYETAYKGDFNQVKVRTDQDSNLPICPDENGRLLIHWAALGGNHHLVEYLIDLGSPVDPYDDTKSTPLILAASAGRVDVVRLLIGKRANVNHKTNRGQTPLHYACSKGHKEVVRLLLQHDANVNETNILGATPLHRAAAQGRNIIVDQLIANTSLQLDICDSTGSTPLHLACEEDREGVASVLVKAGAKLDIMNKEKKSPLDLSSLKLKNTLLSLVE